MSPLPTRTFHIQDIVRGTLVVVFISFLIGYVYFQARHFIQGPQIELTSDVSPVRHERSIALTGHTANITSLTLNGKPVFINEEGGFDQTLVLENGYTIMTLTAEDRYGRVETVTREFVYIENQEAES